MKLNPIGANVNEIELTPNVYILFSYRTPVAMSDSVGLCYVTEKKWSRTTSKHINQWLARRPARKEAQTFFDSIVR